LVGTESNTGLGNGEEEKDGETSVEASDAVLLVSVLDGVRKTLLREFLVELHFSLDIFSGVSDGDFNTTSDTT